MEKRLMTLLAALFLFLGSALAQTNVSGTVTSNDDGEPVVGAAVKVEGTNTGTVTDVDGHFQLNVPTGAKLTISYLGMKPQTVAAKDNMKIVLQSDQHTIDEVVVTGYGVTRKQAFTGAAATLGEKQIGNKVDPNPIKSLEGTVPGLQMNIGSGQPGAPATIYVRGRNSINSGTQPLYVIDGVPFDNDAVGIRSSEGATTSPLSTISAEDIESITVLKDATATSIYGARAANGVIVITTKRGVKGKPKVNFTAKIGWNEMPSYTDKYKLVNADKAIELGTEALMNSYNAYGSSSTFGYMNEGYGLGLPYTKDGARQFMDWYTGGWVSAYDESKQSVDWMDAITRKGLVQSYSVDVQGGGQGDYAPVYYASLSYDKNNSLMVGKDLKRYSFRFNMDHQATKIFKYGFNLNLSYTKTNNGAGGGYFSDPLTQVYMMSPLTPIYNSEGDYNTDTSTGYNPVALRSTNGDKNVAKQYRALLSPYVQINFTPDLFFLSRGGADVYLIDEFGYWSFLNPQGADMSAMGENGDTHKILLSITNTLNYVKSFGNHHLNLMLGQEGQRKYFKQAYLAASNYPVKDMVDVSLASKPSSAATYRNILKLSSFFFNGQYDYDNRYYFSASLRTDGSSRFADGHRWGTFWSVGGKWRISEEKFMEPAKNWLTNLNVRASYGTTGNQEVGNSSYGNGYYAYMGIYNYGYNYNGVGGSQYVQAYNPDLTWEKTGKFNVGLDFTLFDRINVTMDYYNHRTSDMVFAMPISGATGLYDEDEGQASVYRNIGKLENYGFEFGVNATIIKNNTLTWSAAWNGSTNKNKVLKLSTDQPIEGTYDIIEVGKPIYQFYMKEYAGVDPQTGKALFYLNETGDETTTNYNKAAKRYLGDANPKFFGSFSTDLAAYGFDFNVQFNYSTGGKIYGNNLRYDMQSGASFYENFINYVYDNRWTTPGQITDVPRLDTDGSYANKHSSRFLMDGDYLKLRSITLGYTIPRELTNRIGLDRIRVFFEGENLHTWAAKNYIGFDPSGIGSNGVQWWNYPQARSFLFGIQIGL
jgi:TonB-linked SusC/RagA family outer membrane protein